MNERRGWQERRVARFFVSTVIVLDVFQLVYFESGSLLSPTVNFEEGVDF